jgi:lipopolysaccharide export system ATP-binding protein
MEHELVAEGLTKSFKQRVVVDHVDFKVSAGQVVGLLGQNGAGKTTSFYMVAGILKPDEGKVLLNGESIVDLPMYQRARMGIGYLPQEASVFRKLTVEENILAVLELKNLSRKERIKRMEKLLGEFKISHLSKSKAVSLSGGERRRLEIARALAIEPKFLLLDEPFAGIDPLAVADIQGIIGYLKDKGIGILITDHNVRETLKICDVAYILKSGKILEKGSSAYLANSEIARKSYLGEDFAL